MRRIVAAVSVSLLLASSGCQTPSFAESPRSENVIQPLGLEEVTIVAKGLE